MKKILKIFMVLVVMLLGTSSIVSATENKKDVAINKQNFPDNYLRSYLSEIFDDNNDGILQQNEISNVQYIPLDMSGEYTGHNDMNGQDNINCKGLSYFKNLKYLVLIGGSNKANIYNINEIEGLTKLTSLYISSNRKACNLDLSKLKKLEELRLDSFKKLNKLKFRKNIKNLYLAGLSGNATLDLSKQKYLDEVELRYINLKKIYFGKNKYINSLYIYSEREIKNKKTKMIDVSNLKNLEKLYIVDFQNLKTVKLGKNKKLTDISVYRCKKVKKINVKKCKNVQNMYLGKKIKVLKNKKQKIKVKRYKYRE